MGKIVGWGFLLYIIFVNMYVNKNIYIRIACKFQCICIEKLKPINQIRISIRNKFLSI